MHRLATSVFGLLVSAAVGFAQFVTPSGYTLSTPGEGQAQGGSFNYFDDGGNQLTDGILGANNWAANLGNGPAYEWVGWVRNEPTITFNFASPVDIDLVEIGFNRATGAGIYIPSTVTIAGNPTALVDGNYINGARHWISFATNLNNVTSVNISLSDGNANRWIFVDEIRFSVVPEPTTLALLAGGSLALLRRRRAMR